jgi:hypothetical protein
MRDGVWLSRLSVGLTDVVASRVSRRPGTHTARLCTVSLAHWGRLKPQHSPERTAVVGVWVAMGRSRGEGGNGLRLYGLRGSFVASCTAPYRYDLRSYALPSTVRLYRVRAAERIAYCQLRILRSIYILLIYCWIYEKLSYLVDSRLSSETCGLRWCLARSGVRVAVGLTTDEQTVERPVTSSGGGSVLGPHAAALRVPRVHCYCTVQLRRHRVRTTVLAPGVAVPAIPLPRHEPVGVETSSLSLGLRLRSSVSVIVSRYTSD